MYKVVVINNGIDYRMYRVREKFAEEFATWFTARYKGMGTAFLTACTPFEDFPKLPKEIVRSFLVHRKL